MTKGNLAQMRMNFGGANMRCYQDSSDFAVAGVMISNVRGRVRTDPAYLLTEGMSL